MDNEAKACLDDIALNMQRSSDAKLAVVGNAASTEKAGSKAAASRAVNAKDYLVTEKGIDASRISVYTGSQDGQTVSSTLIPTGATLDQTGLTAVDESAVKVVPRTPPPRRRRSKSDQALTRKADREPTRSAFFLSTELYPDKQVDNLVTGAMRNRLSTLFTLLLVLVLPSSWSHAARQ